MSNIHATAQVDPGAKLGSNVEIGAFCVVGPHAELGDNVVLRSHVVIEGRTTIGAGCKIFPFASVGLEPQDVKYKDDPSTVTIGENTLIREHVTVHRGTPTGHLATHVGSNCFLMIGAHVAHDCQIGDNVTLVNGVTLGGRMCPLATERSSGGSPRCISSSASAPIRSWAVCRAWPPISFPSAWLSATGPISMDSTSSD